MTTKKLSQLFFPLLIVFSLLTACVPAQPAAPVLSLDGTQWDLVGFVTPDAMTPPVENTQITLDFADRQVGGTAGCNGYGASYTLNGNQLSFSTEGFVSTMMFCDGAGIMEQENQFLTWLPKAETVELNGDELTIHTSEGDLVFKKAQHTALEGTNWQLSGLVEGEAVSSTLVDENINIQFVGGQAAGSAGCNQFFADYVLDGQKLSLSTIGGTKMACEEDINLREAAFLHALAEVASYQLERSSLTLLDANGNMLMSFYAGQ
ncbi:MAG: META domain-containing protein [Anaerolineales bacterium]